ncbi:hypothetical protein L3V82_12065 [Thiotrichales bacterium 19S3-7]|nr:hypothetical protein [Thiotrichales bacterium 19S3-7]MCF6802929.1 hypothetical protein [Thiotrichales bacterium 19S3-11]
MFSTSSRRILSRQIHNAYKLSRANYKKLKKSGLYQALASKSSHKLSIKRQFTTVNIIDSVITNNPKLLKSTTSETLIQFRKLMKNKTLNDVRMNQFLTGSKESLVTAEQVKSYFLAIDLFLEINPSLKGYFDIEVENLLYRGGQVNQWLNMEFRHKENHKSQNPTKKAINLLNESLFDELPSSNNPSGTLSTYGKTVREEMGEDSFLRATQLLTNQLAEDLGYNPTTDAHLTKPLGAYASTWKCPSRAYFIEMQADKSDIPTSEQIHCMEDQLQLVEIAYRDGKFNSMQFDEITSGILRYIKRQDEVLVSPSHLRKSSDIFYDTEMRLTNPVINPDLYRDI